MTYVMKWEVKVGTETHPCTNVSITKRLNEVGSFSFSVENTADMRSLFVCDTEVKILLNDTQMLEGIVEKTEVVREYLRVHGRESWIKLKRLLFCKYVSEGWEASPFAADYTVKTESSTTYVLKKTLSFEKTTERHAIGKLKISGAYVILSPAAGATGWVRYDIDGTTVYEGSLSATELIPFDALYFASALLSHVEDFTAYAEGTHTVDLYLKVEISTTPPTTISNHLLELYASRKRREDVVNYTSTAADVIARDILDGTGFSLVECPTTTISIKLESLTKFEALLKLAEVLGKDIWCEADGIHIGTKGKSVGAIEEYYVESKETNYDTIINKVYVEGSNVDGDDILVVSEDADSQSKYGKRELMITEQNAADTSTLQSLADYYLSQLKDPSLSVKLRHLTILVLEKGIDVGDTVYVEDPALDLKASVRIYELKIGSMEMAKLHCESAPKRLTDIVKELLYDYSIRRRRHLESSLIKLSSRARLKEWRDEADPAKISPYALARKPFIIKTHFADEIFDEAFLAKYKSGFVRPGMTTISGIDSSTGKLNLTEIATKGGLLSDLLTNKYWTATEELSTLSEVDSKISTHEGKVEIHHLRLSEDYWGDGSDGDVVFSADTTLTQQEYQYNNLTIDAGVTVTGYSPYTVIRVKNTLTVNGTLKAASYPSGGAGGENGGAGGAGGGLLFIFAKYITGSGVISANGVNGGAGGGGAYSAVDGSAGTGAQYEDTIYSASEGGLGSRTGGDAGTSIDVDIKKTVNAVVGVIEPYWFTMMPGSGGGGGSGVLGDVLTHVDPVGGGGGAGGSCWSSGGDGGNGGTGDYSQDVTAGAGGGGGGAGGILFVVAENISGTLSLQAKGGDGGDGGDAASENGGGGGGGGAGAGGQIFVVTFTLAETVTYDVSEGSSGLPGLGGTPSGGGAGWVGKGAFLKY